MTPEELAKSLGGTLKNSTQAPMQPMQPSTSGVPNADELARSLGGSFSVSSEPDTNEMFNFLTGQTPEPPKGFIERVKADLQSRESNLQEGVYGGGSQSMAEDIFQTLGQGAGFATDVLGEAIKSVGYGIGAITPDIIEKPITEGIKSTLKAIAQTPVIQSGLDAIGQGVDAYNFWKKTHPREARNIESVVNIGLLLPVGRVAKEGAGVTELGGKALIRSGQAGVTATRKSFLEDLVHPLQTKAVKEAQVPRTSEAGFGPFRRSVVVPSGSEARSIEALTNISSVKPSNTLQRNYNAIRSENLVEATNLKNELIKNDFIYPRKELLARLRTVKSRLAESPFITGDAEKSADKLISKVRQMIEEKPSKGSNLLEVRKEFDNWIESQKPTVFDAKTESALTIANREIRSEINTFLNEKAPNVKVRESLAKQSSLFRALDNIKPKAAQEADTAFGRAFQRAGQILGTKNRIVQAIAAAVGIGGLGAAATFAPGASVVGIGGFLTYKAGKLILKPQVRVLFGQILESTIGKTTGGIVAGGVVAELRDEINDLLEKYD